MSDRKTAALRAMCAEWKTEIQRLEDELARPNTIVDATGLAIAVTIRREAVSRIEAIIGANPLAPTSDPG